MHFRSAGKCSPLRSLKNRHPMLLALPVGHSSGSIAHWGMAQAGESQQRAANFRAVASPLNR